MHGRMVVDGSGGSTLIWADEAGGAPKAYGSTIDDVGDILDE